MSSDSAGEGQKDSSQPSSDHSSGSATDKPSSCEASRAMLPKALTVSPTDLFPEEQFETSDSEDDAELHAFTQRLDADWRSNLSQALSWSAKSPCTVTPSSVKGFKSTHKEDAMLNESLHDLERSSGVTSGAVNSHAVDKAVDSLCHNMETQVSLSTGDVTGTLQCNEAESKVDSETPGTRSTVRVKPRLKVREAAHVLTARSKQARAARAAARNKQGHNSQENVEVAVPASSAAECNSDQGPMKADSDTLPSSPVGGAKAASDGYPVTIAPSCSLPAAHAGNSSSIDASLDVYLSHPSLPGAGQNGRPLAKQHRSSSAHPAYQSITAKQLTPIAPVAASTGEAVQITAAALPQLQLPTPQPARGAAAVPVALPGSDPLPQTEFSPPVGGPIFHAGLAQRHPTITTRYRAKRSSETPKSSPIAYTGTSGSSGATQQTSSLRALPGVPNGVATAASAHTQQSMPSPTAAKPSHGPGSQVSHWAPPLPQQSPFGVSRYAVPAVGVPSQAHLNAANSFPGLTTAPSHVKYAAGLGGSTPCQKQHLQHGPVDSATAADCAAQLRAAALAQYILSTAPTLMPTVFGHMSADAVAQALPALASASGLLAASMSRPPDSTEGSNATDLLSQVKKRYPSLQIPSDLVTSARSDTQQASNRAEKRKEEDAANLNTKSAKGKKKSAKKTKSKKVSEEVDMQGTMLAVLEELLPGDVMLSLDGSQITFEAVLKSQDHVGGIAYDSAAFNSTAVATSPLTPTGGASHSAQVHPVAFIPAGPGDSCSTQVAPASAMACSMLASVPVCAAVTGPAHSLPPLSTADGTQTAGSPAPKSCLPDPKPEDAATGYIPSCTRPYGMTIDELLAAWPVREWCAAPTYAEVESLVTQCQALNKRQGATVTPRVTQFDLPPEQLVYALAMLANWDCARVYQVLTTIDVDFRAIALRLPQAGLWFRCQPSMAEVHSCSAAPTRSPLHAHTKSPADGEAMLQSDGIAKSSHATAQHAGAEKQQSACLKAREIIDQLAATGHTAEDAKQRRNLDCVAVKDMFEGILEHMGMSDDLQIVHKQCTDDSKAQSSSTNRYSFTASSWPRSEVWTRCLGALDCLQVRYLQRPSDEHLFPALPASIKPAHATPEPMQSAGPDRSAATSTKETGPVGESSIPAGGNAVDAAQSFGAPSHIQENILQPSGFGQPAGDASLLPGSETDQREHRSEAADSECSIM